MQPEANLSADLAGVERVRRKIQIQVFSINVDRDVAALVIKVPGHDSHGSVGGLNDKHRSLISLGSVVADHLRTCRNKVGIMFQRVIFRSICKSPRLGVDPDQTVLLHPQGLSPLSASITFQILYSSQPFPR